jgi:hypothetical protein
MSSRSSLRWTISPNRAARTLRWSKVGLLPRTPGEINKLVLLCVCILTKFSPKLQCLCSLFSILNEKTGLLAARTVCNITSSENCRQALIDQGVIAFLTGLIEKTPSGIAIKSQCSLALGYLSELTLTNTGMVESIIQIEKEVNNEPVNQGIKSSPKKSALAKWGVLRDTSKDAEARKKLVITRLTANKKRETEIFTLVRYERPTKPLSRTEEEFDEDSSFYLDEHDVLNFDYSDYYFENITLFAKPADSGISREIIFQSSFPYFEERDKEKRLQFDLLDIPIDMSSLPKEMQTFDVSKDHFISEQALLDYENRHHSRGASLESASMLAHTMEASENISSSSGDPLPRIGQLRDMTNFQNGVKFDVVDEGNEVFLASRDSL